MKKSTLILLPVLVLAAAAVAANPQRPANTSAANTSAANTSAANTSASGALEGVEDTGTPDEIMTTMESMTLVENTAQTCYSARGCSGKVLSHRDAHNCKVKSRGKSWRSSAGQCYNL